MFTIPVTRRTPVPSGRVRGSPTAAMQARGAWTTATFDRGEPAAVGKSGNRRAGELKVSPNSSSRRAK
eukprot:9632691-Heterocapsa_arctica.AAC.1